MSHWSAGSREAARLRDRNVRLLRRIGAGVVSLGVFGSFGLAGYLAATSQQTGTAASAGGSPAPQQPASSSGSGTLQKWLHELGQGVSGEHADDGGEGADDDGGGFVLPLPQLGTGQPPDVQPGSGSVPHTTTQGS